MSSGQARRSRPRWVPTEAELHEARTAGVPEKLYVVCRRRRFTHQQALTLAGTDTFVSRGRRCEADLQLGLAHTDHAPLVEAVVAGVRVSEYVRALATGLSHDDVLAVIRAGIQAGHLTVTATTAEWFEVATHPMDAGFYSAARCSPHVTHIEALRLHATLPAALGAGYATARDAGDTDDEAIGGLRAFGHRYPRVRSFATAAETFEACRKFGPPQLVSWYQPLRSAGASHDDAVRAFDRHRDSVAELMHYVQLRCAGADDRESVEVIAGYPVDVYVPARTGGATHSEACAVADIRAGIGPLAVNRYVRLRSPSLGHDAAFRLAQMAPTEVSGYLKARRCEIEHQVCMDLADAGGSLARFGELLRTGTGFAEAWSASLESSAEGS